MSSKDDNQAFDYVASVINPTFSGMSAREELARKCMHAIFKEADGTIFFEKFHPEAHHLLELFALRLMGEEWCQAWIEHNIYGTLPSNIA